MILTLDVGSSSVRASLHDGRARLLPGRLHQVPCAAEAGADGRAEHAPEALLAAVAACLDAAHGWPEIAGVEAVGVATFWHGLLGLGADGRPVTPVIGWADTRAAGAAARLLAGADEVALHARTGCHLHPCYWPAKLRWLAETAPATVTRVARWGSIGEYLEWTLFGEATTSLSMASGTGLLDQEAARWDPAALALAGLDETRLFALRDRDEPRVGLRAPWAARWPALRDVRWFPAVGDGAASSVGSGGVDPSRVVLNVGTSAALRVTTATPPPPVRGLWRYHIDRHRFLTGGATSEGGNVHAWCRRTLRLPEGPALEAALARQAPDAHGLTVLPFLAGERAPGWRPARRATIDGLGLDTTAVGLLRAALEAVALRLALIHDLLAPLAAPDHAVVASGAAIAASSAWAAIIADALGRPLALAAETEATSRGAAVLALHALGRVADLDAMDVTLTGTVAPDGRRHARYRAALARQQALDARLAGGDPPHGPSAEGMI